MTRAVLPATVLLAALCTAPARGGEPVRREAASACMAASAPVPSIPAAASPVPDAPWGLAALTAAEDRLLVARALAADRATHEEALDALLALLGEPATAGRAHLALFALALDADPRPGWLDVYERLATDRRTTASEATAIRLRAAEARTWVPAAHEEARATLAAAAARGAEAGTDTRGELPGDRSWQLSWHLGRAHLVLGEVEAAARLFATRAGDPRFDAGARVAALGTPGAPAPLAARIHAIAAAGYPDLALRLAPRDDPSRVDPGAWAAHARVLLGRGRLLEALAAAGGFTDPGSVELRTQLLLALGRLDDARRAAEGVPAAERRVRAVAVASEDPDLAWALAPDEPLVAHARAADRLRTGRPAEAAALLAPLVAVGPPDLDTLTAYAHAALAADDIDSALSVWRAAVTRASGPPERSVLLRGLTDTLARAAETRKGGGDPRGAVALYQVAVLARPDAPGLWSGLGGALWGSAALEGAQAAYTRAASLVLDQAGPAHAAGRLGAEGYLGSAADLALARGRPAEAAAILAPFVGSSPSLAARAALAEAAVLGAPEPLERLDLLLRAHPDDAVLAGVVARALAAAGHLEASLRAWESAVEADPEGPAPRVGKALALAALGRLDAAFATLDEAGPAGAADIRVARAALHRARGDTLWLVDGRDSEALVAYGDALATAPDAWAWTAIGGLYLSHGQAAAALAAFRAARVLDPENRLALAGEAKALVANGDLGGARALVARASDAGLVAEVEAAIGAASVARAAVLLALGEVEAARGVLTPLRDHRPAPPGLAAMLAAVDLAAGDAIDAFAGSRAALRADPQDARAASVLVDAAIESGELATAATLLDGLAQGPGGADDRFVVELASARILAARGLLAQARRRLDRLSSSPPAVAPDRLALLGGAWLALGDPASARVAYASALDVSPDHASSIEGLAAVALAEGQPRVARTLLTDACERTGDPFVGAALARLDDHTGALRNVALREAVRGRGAAPTVKDPLPVLAGLPTANLRGASIGSVPASGTSTVLLTTRPVAIDASLGVLARPGATGTNRLLADAATVSLVAPVGSSVHLDASVLVLGLSDGEHDRLGAAGAIGVATLPQSRLRVRGVLGITPVGVEAPPTLTWFAALGWRARHVEVGVDTLRAPITDSVASWGGLADEGGVWGQALTTLGGAWLGWNREASDLGARGRIGTVSALGAAPTGRRQLDLWAGHRLGAPDRGVRLGLTGTLLAHDTQLDTFAPGGAGAFTPLAYRAGGGRVDGTWRLAGGARLCGGANLGVQHVEGAESAFFAAGTSLAVGVNAGGAVRLGRHWTGGVSARWELVGEDWSEQTGAAWVRWMADPLADRVALPPVYGAGVTGLGGCG
ncbi:MAG: cellulose synthase subunit BcsC-related outer membrane protein [Pseudomonadota bacterium]|nr:cellulose synthase subunit BcsC-related outer membrane protein [Pseudomonadota bacterium]